MHTPGPWKAEKIRDAIPYNWRITSASGLEIAEVEDWVDERRESGLGESNARLIAAAPEMYDLLRRLHDAVFVAPLNADDYYDDWMAARALLAKIVAVTNPEIG